MARDANLTKSQSQSDQVLTPTPGPKTWARPGQRPARRGGRVAQPLSTCICVSVEVYVFAHTHTHKYFIYIYILYIYTVYIYMCMRVQ